MRNRLVLAAACILAAVLPCGAVVAPHACIGSLPVSSFQLTVAPAKGGSPIAVESVNELLPGEKLKYTPVKLAPEIKDKARIALILVPAAEGLSEDVRVLDARPAKASAEWEVPIRSSVVGVVFGPRGLNVKKVSSLVKRDPDLIPELAQYAQQSATVEALVQTLSEYEQSPSEGGDLNAALQGFSSQYGVILPRLSSSAPTDEQASTLLRAVLPTLSSYDPLNSRSAVVAQSAGLAASVAGLFFGTPVGLAAGGAALVNNMRTMMFPDTNFRSAFAQPEPSGAVELCAKREPAKSRTRTAYLWMLQVPNAPAPKVSLASAAHLPAGVKSTLKVTSPKSQELRLLGRARDWQLVSSTHRSPVPVSVDVGTGEDSLSVDLSQSKLPPGEYRLAARWDWEPFEVAGTVAVHSFSNFSAVKVARAYEDRLVEGSGPVNVKLTGADFEFVDHVSITQARDASAKPREIFFTLPKGEGEGDQGTLRLQLNTSELAAGRYLLGLVQSNGSTHNVPVTIHPPNPTLTNLPIRVNVGRPEQKVELRGTNLERIAGLASRDAEWEITAAPAGAEGLSERSATIKLGASAREGDELSASMTVEGIGQPLEIAHAIQVAGPQPKIVSVRESFAQGSDVALRDGEIPSGSPVSFAIDAGNLDAQPTLDLACSNAGDSKQSLNLRPGDREHEAQLDFAGQGVLFLSLDPGLVGQTGCILTATVTTPSAGSSDAYTLGRVIRLPRIEKFTLSSDRLGGSLYAGTLSGQNLQMIEKTGWNARMGYTVRGIPTPVPGGDPQEQTLEIALPWPPPSPRAPLYIWLQGETQGRLTRAEY